MKSSREDSNCYYKWYPGDYQRDTNLQVCSFVARALWREMLDMMFDAPIRGTLTIGDSYANAKQMSVAKLARRVRIDEAECAALLTELEEAGVFSMHDDGTIYNRRMYREARAKAQLSKSRTEAANTRWSKEKTCNTNANSMQEPCKPMHSASVSASYSASESESEMHALHRARDPKLPKAPPDLPPEETARFTALAKEIRKRCPKARNRIVSAMAMDDLQKWRTQTGLQHRPREPTPIVPLTDLLKTGTEEIRKKMHDQ